MRKPIRIIKAGEIKQNYSMHKAIEAMEKAFSLLSSGESFVPEPYTSVLPSQQLIMILKPALVEKDQRATLKFITQREGRHFDEIPTIQGIIMVLNAVTGEILSIMDGEYITALRTGAASGLATRFFARKDAQKLALFGCGAQGKTQLEAVICERDIRKVMVFDRNEKRASEFIQEMHKKLNLPMEYCTNNSILAEADIICTATNSEKPLFLKEDVKNGVHINAIGSFQPKMQELDPYLIKAGKVYADHRELCLKESGDLIKPIAEGMIMENHIIGEIGDVCLNRIKGRESDDEITIFKSVGVAIQDYVVATDIYKAAITEGFGLEINLFD